jgi:hypothetical protein
MLHPDVIVFAISKHASLTFPATARSIGQLEAHRFGVIFDPFEIAGRKSGVVEAIVFPPASTQCRASAARNQWIGG